MSNDFPQTIKASPRLWLRIVKGIVVSLILFFLGAIGLMEWNRYLSLRDFDETVSKLDKEDPNWRIEKLREGLPELPEKENSARVISAIFAEGNPIQEAELSALDGLYDVPPNMLLSNETMNDLDNFLKKLAPILEKAVKLKDFSEGRFPPPNYTADYVSTPLNYISDTRLLSSVLLADAIFQLQNENTMASWNSTKAALQCSEALMDDPMILSVFVRVAIRSMVAKQIERMVNQMQLTSPQLRDMRQKVDELVDDELLIMGLRGMRAGNYQTVNAVLNNEFHLLDDGKGQVKAMSWWEKIMQRYHSTILLDAFPLIVERLERAMEIAKLPVVAQQEKFSEFEKESKSDFTTNQANLIANSLVAPLVRACAVSPRDRALLLCTQTGIAVEQFRRKNQRLPNSLQELVETGFLTNVPVDPYNGEPLQYRQSKKGAIVFSVGPDKDNEGGSLDDPYLQYPHIRIEFRIYLPELRRQPFQMPQFPDGEEFLP